MDRNYRYELLDAAVHDSASFTCGVPALDRYLRPQARQDMRSRVAAVYIQRTADSPTILGYYSISNLSIEARDLPSDLVKRLSRYPVLPAPLIGRLAVDQEQRGKGLGGLLLFDGLRRALRSDIASLVVVVDPKDDRARLFYEHYGFRLLRADPPRLFLPMKDIAALFESHQ